MSFWIDNNLENAKTANNKPLIVKKTAEMGGFNIKSLPTGTYRVMLKKAGYADLIVTESVNDGEMTAFNANLEKI